MAPYKLLILSVAGLLALLGGCKKEKTPLDQLPDATQEGKGTAGWLVDGKAYVPVRSSISVNPPVNGSWRKTKGGHSLGVSFHQVSVEEDWGAGFFIPDIRQLGTFELAQEPAITGGLFKAAYGEYDHLRPGPDRLSYYTSPNARGTLIITRFDTINDIVSGTFEMSPEEATTGEIIQITQGRFDLHFDR